VQLHRAREQFEEAGVSLVLIGQASPRQAAAFRRKLKIDDVDVLADEERVTYKALGFPRASVSQLLGPKSVLSGVKHVPGRARPGPHHRARPHSSGGAISWPPGGEVVLRAGPHATTGDNRPRRTRAERPRRACSPRYRRPADWHRDGESLHHRERRRSPAAEQGRGAAGPAPRHVPPPAREHVKTRQALAAEVQATLFENLDEETWERLRRR
jgi:hypothetical protein